MSNPAEQRRRRLHSLEASFPLANWCNADPLIRWPLVWAVLLGLCLLGGWLDQGDLLP